MSSEAHEHHHGADLSLLSLDRGIRAVKLSLLVLAGTALFQGIIAVLGGSAALLADTIHNFADMFTAVPLWIAFALSRRQASRRFSYGYERAEDVAGAVVLLFILASAGLAAWESIRKLLQPEIPGHLEWGIAAGLVGLAGNELAARYRIRVGREIGSAALVADGQHARADGLTSLGVVVGLVGVRLGYPWADPVTGLLISLLIVRIAWEVGRDVLGRLMDSIEPETIERIERLAAETQGVISVHDVRARWVGHSILAELHLDLRPDLSLAEAHDIAENVRHTLLHEVTRLRDVIVHLDPAGPDFHQVTAHHFATGGAGDHGDDTGRQRPDYEPDATHQQD